MAAIRQHKGSNGKKFAVIADEAHSSPSPGDRRQTQSGPNRRRTPQDIEDGGEIDVEAILAAEATDRADSSNISYFAFTATPKGKTLELFGRRPRPDEPPAPFHVYTMKQAIEGATSSMSSPATTASHWPSRSVRRWPTKSTSRSGRNHEAVMKWVKINPQTISPEVGDHRRTLPANVAHLLDGHAKAMVVADSRKPPSAETRDRRPHHQEGLRLPHPGRVLRQRHRPRVRSRLVDRGEHEPGYQ